jgi:hypothetical protein
VRQLHEPAAVRPDRVPGKGERTAPADPRRSPSSGPSISAASAAAAHPSGPDRSRRTSFASPGRPREANWRAASTTPSSGAPTAAGYGTAPDT